MTPESEALLRLAHSQAKLMESIALDYQAFDSRDLGIGDDPRFLPMGASQQGKVWLNRQKRGEFIPAYLTENELSLFRRRIRGLVLDSEVALNVIGVHQSYAVGDGFKYEVTPRGTGTSPTVVRDCQAVVDAFVEHNELALREVEIVARELTDGEALVRLFPSHTGIISLRTVEPEFLRSPVGDSGLSSFGVQSLPGDVESVTHYWIDDSPTGTGENLHPVPASDVVHFKHHETPSTCKRGLSAFFPVESTLRAAEDLLQSTVSLAKARAKIAWFRKIQGATADVASALVQAQAQYTATDPVSQESVNMERYRYGTILTIPSNMEVEMPSANIAAADHVAVMQMVLRMVASRFCIPEYMLTSDASNANYSSTLVAESPFVKTMQRYQDHLARLLGRNRYPGPRQSLVWRQLDYASKVGILPQNLQSLIDVQVTGPTLTVRDTAKEAQVDQIYHEMGVKSLTTIQMEQGLDPDEQQMNFIQERRSQPRVAPSPALESSDWDESKHPRAGDGKFGGGGPTPSKDGRKKDVASRYDARRESIKAVQAKLETIDALTPGYGTMGDRVKAAYATIARGEASHADVYAASSIRLSGVKRDYEDKAARMVSVLADAGAKDSDVSRVNGAVAKGVAKVEKATIALAKAHAAFGDAIREYAKQKEKAPSPPEEPEDWMQGLPDDVDPDTEEYERAIQSAQLQDERRQAEYQAAKQRYDKATADHEMTMERLDAKLSQARERVEALDNDLQDAYEAAGSALESVAGRVRDRLDDELTAEHEKTYAAEDTERLGIDDEEDSR